MPRDEQPDDPRSLLLPLALAATCVFLWPATLTFSAGDWPSPNQFPHNDPPLNACGVVGATCAYYLRYYLGDGAYPLLLFLSLAAFLKLLRGEVRGLMERGVGLALVVACTSASAFLIGTTGSGSLPMGEGGMFGRALGELMRDNLSRVGTLIVMASSLVVGLLFVTEGWVLRLPSMLKRAGEASGDAVAGARRVVASAMMPRAVAEGVTAAERSGLLERDFEEEPARPPRRRTRKPRREPSNTNVEGRRDDESDTDAARNPDRTHRLKAVDHERESPEDAKVARKTGKPATPIVNFPSPQRSARAEPYPKQIENWRLPALQLLREPTYGFSAQQEVIVREKAAVLERTLEEFRLDARVVEIDTGPVITMFELKLGAGIKVSQIGSLANDIARALKAPAVRVVAPISGKNTVGIEVPNVDKEKVSLRELMTLSGGKASQMDLPLFLGKDAAGAPLVFDLARMPHLLIAGTTGSGKSVCINAMILSLLMTKRPDHVKMILIDPKMVEMSQFKDVPHLMCPIVTDMHRAEKILEWAVTTMEERYAILAEARVKNIGQYNELGPEGIYERLCPKSDEERARITVRLPHVVILIDELADLMMTSAKEVEHHLSRLAQKSRAVGIHIIVATQRPEAKVVTGLIKSNLPSRICFRVASRIDSRIVLDQNGGEVLMGQGDMLFLPPGSHKLMRCQGTFLDESEVHAVLDDLASRSKPEYHPALMRIKAPGSDEGNLLRDPRFDDAVRIVLESKRGSVSLLQRRLTIGYSRASRLIDQMSEAGIVGQYKGSQAREVQMSLDEWDALKTNVSADLEAGYEADEEVETEANAGYSAQSN